MEDEKIFLLSCEILHDLRKQLNSAVEHVFPEFGQFDTEEKMFILLNPDSATGENILYLEYSKDWENSYSKNS